MLVDTGDGRSYSGQELSASIRAAGFVGAAVKPLPKPANTSLIIATKP
jgi:hypothetical protein